MDNLANPPEAQNLGDVELDKSLVSFRKKALREEARNIDKFEKYWMAKSQDAVRQRRLDKTELIPAIDARYIADTTPAILKRISKFIRAAAADEASTTLKYIAEDVSNPNLNFVIEELVKAGYTVKLENNVLIINW